MLANQAFYAIAMLVTALVFWMFSFTDKSHNVHSSVTVADQLKALKDAEEAMGAVVAAIREMESAGEIFLVAADED